MSYERRKVRTGRVVSDKMDRTIVVQVEWRSPHRLYKKPIRRMSKFKVHDPENISMVGDIVQVMESRPRSKTKRWRLVRVLQRSEMVDIRPEDIGEDSQTVEVSEPAVEPEAVVVAGVQPEVETETVEEVEPVAEAEPEAETEAVEEAEPVAEAEPEAETEAIEEAEPAVEAEPEVEAESVEEAELVVEVEAAIEVEAETVEDVEPVAEAAIEVEAETAEDAEPIAEETVEPAVEAQDTEPSAADADVEPAAELQPDGDTPSEGADGKTETETR